MVNSTGQPVPFRFVCIDDFPMNKSRRNITYRIFKLAIGYFLFNVVHPRIFTISTFTLNGYKWVV